MENYWFFEMFLKIRGVKERAFSYILNMFDFIYQIYFNRNMTKIRYHIVIVKTREKMSVKLSYNEHTSV